MQTTTTTIQVPIDGTFRERTRINSFGVQRKVWASDTEPREVPLLNATEGTAQHGSMYVEVAADMASTIEDGTIIATWGGQHRHVGEALDQGLDEAEASLHGVQGWEVTGRGKTFGRGGELVQRLYVQALGR